MKIMTSAQMKEAEKLSVDNGLTYLGLMENAGYECFLKIKEKAENKSKITILCGPGNNGGDGFVIAKHLIKSNYDVRVILVCGEPKTDIANRVYRRLNNCNIYDLKSDYDVCQQVTLESDLVVDCVFGVGSTRKVENLTADFFEFINSLNLLKISIDVPSGVDSDRAEILGTCILADYTIAICSLKPCHVFSPTKETCGNISTVSIGITDKDIENAGTQDYYARSFEEIKSSFKPRNPISNKGDFGKVLLVCGSKNMPGAAVLASKGAVKCGAGLVYLAFPDSAYSAISSKLTIPVLMPMPSDENGYFSKCALDDISEKLKMVDVVLIGCGIGVNEDTKYILDYIVKNSEVPIIIDADGINIISQNINILKTSRVPIILTPHPGEMSRLTGLTIGQIQSNRIQTAKDFVNKHSVILALKGANTVVATPDNGEVYINTTGNAGMAKGGSGDLLAGIIASFVAQGMLPEDAAECGVFIHGMAGDLAAREKSMISSNALDMIDCLPLVFSSIESRGV